MENATRSGVKRGGAGCAQAREATISIHTYTYNTLDTLIAVYHILLLIEIILASVSQNVGERWGDGTHVALEK